MWRSVLGVLATATAYALAMPPVGAGVLAWVALVPLLSVANGASPARAAAWGAATGFATATAVTWWLAQAIAAYFATGILGGAVATAAAYVVAVSTTFAAFSVAASAVLRAPERPHTPFTLAALWVAAELVRARAFADPWALLGYTQHANVGLIQVAALTGVYGVSFLVALGNAAIALALRQRAARALALPTAAIGLCWAAGVAATPATPPPAAGYRVAVIQPNVEPAFAWTPAWADVQLGTHVRMTRETAAAHPALVVWPENSVAHYLDERRDVARLLERLARDVDADLVVGGPRAGRNGVHNTARLVRARGGLGDAYDKQRLVPFAERRLLAHAGDETRESPRMFAAGSAPGVLRGPSLLGLSICHEILYPDVVLGSVRAGADVLVNVANDGWLDGGYGVASRQHAAMAVFRAVETRRWLVRAATTGVSMVVAPSGEVVARQAPGTAGVLVAAVAPRRTVTPYTHVGDLFALLCALWAALGARRLPVRAPARAPAEPLPAPV